MRLWKILACVTHARDQPGALPCLALLADPDNSRASRLDACFKQSSIFPFP